MLIKTILPFCLLISFLSFLPQKASACSCLPFGNDFFETIYLHNQKIAQGEWAKDDMGLTVIAAEVSSHLTPRQSQDLSPASLEVKVIGLIQGELETQNLVIQGGNGASCEVPVENFKVGQKYLMGLSKNSVGNYFMSLCGNYFIELSSVLKPEKPLPQKPSPDESL